MVVAVFGVLFDNIFCRHDVSIEDKAQAHKVQPCALRSELTGDPAADDR